MLGIDVKAARYTWTAAVVLLLLFVVYEARETIFIFVIALMFAYLLYPLFDAIDKRMGLRTRGPALALTYALLIMALAGFGTFIGTNVAREAGQLAVEARQLPQFAAKIQQWRILDFPVGQQIVSHYTQVVDRIPSLTIEVLSASTNLLDLIIVPILSFFILKDGRAIRDGFLEFMDTGRETAQDLMADAHSLMLQYMRALLLLCLCTLVVYSVVLSIMGVPYALLLASIAFPLEFVPLVGPLSAAALVLAVSFFSGYSNMLAVFIFLMVYRMFQDYILSPHLMSKGVELPPLLVIFGVIAGGEIGGVAGIFLSIPLLALLRLMQHRLRKSHVVGSGRIAEPSGVIR